MSGGDRQPWGSDWFDWWWFYTRWGGGYGGYFGCNHCYGHCSIGWWEYIRTRGGKGNRFQIEGNRPAVLSLNDLYWVLIYSASVFSDFILSV